MSLLYLVTIKGFLGIEMRMGSLLLIESNPLPDLGRLLYER